MVEALNYWYSLVIYRSGAIVESLSWGWVIDIHLLFPCLEQLSNPCAEVVWLTFACNFQVWSNYPILSLELHVWYLLANWSSWATIQSLRWGRMADFSCNLQVQSNSPTPAPHGTLGSRDWYLLGICRSGAIIQCLRRSRMIDIACAGVAWLIFARNLQVWGNAAMSALGSHGRYLLLICRSRAMLPCLRWVAWLIFACNLQVWSNASMPAQGSHDWYLLVIYRSGAMLQCLRWGRTIDICL